MKKEKMVQISKKLDRYKDRKLWYFDMQGEIFPYSMKTKRGYLVFRNDVEGNQMWLIRTKHAEEIEGTLLG